MDSTRYKKLTPQEERVIIHKGTQAPYTGEYDDMFEDGMYLCKQCGEPLYKSSQKFHSGCGWPAFDDEIKGAVTRVPDADGRRVEIVCSKCGGHLGHVFEGEQFTPTNTRHCVNSISLEFVSKDKFAKAYFAGGCFWGVEYYFDKLDGVISAVSGYMGGDTPNPTYQDVCSKTTGHLEVVEVSYDTSKVDFETLAKLFFEIHDPTQTNGQGPDIGPQYLSAVFYTDDEQKEIAQKLIEELKTKGFDIATKLIDASKHTFYKAEDYHQDYYHKKGQKPYCHMKVNRF